MTEAKERRIAPLAPEHWGGETLDTIFRIAVRPDAPFSGRDFNAILVMANHPELTLPWLHFNNVAAAGVTIPTRIKEIAILRVAARYDCDYEWVQHCLIGANAGLSTEHLEAAKVGADHPIWTEDERAVVRLADDLSDGTRASDETFAALSAHFDSKQIVELLYVAGAYQLLAFMFNTAGVQIEPSYLARALDQGAPMLRDEPPMAADPPKPD